MSKQQSQEYKGNGNHEWEDVAGPSEALHVGGTDEFSYVERLRVPGGWLYRVTRLVTSSEQANVYGDCDVEELSAQMNTVFVPMPEVVKHAV